MFLIWAIRRICLGMGYGRRYSSPIFLVGQVLFDYQPIRMVRRLHSPILVLQVVLGLAVGFLCKVA